MAMELTEEEWKQRLTPEQYHILRERGTEHPFTGEHVKPGKDGVFTCVACGTPLFKSSGQYDSRQPGLEGWPSFADAVNSDAVELQDDDSLGMHRTEVVCKNCGGHLGHIFDDPDSPTGKHYCINSCILDFKPETK